MTISSRLHITAFELPFTLCIITSDSTTTGQGKKFLLCKWADGDREGEGLCPKPDSAESLNTGRTHSCIRYFMILFIFYKSDSCLLWKKKRKLQKRIKMQNIIVQSSSQRWVWSPCECFLPISPLAYIHDVGGSRCVLGIYTCRAPHQALYKYPVT